MSTTPAAVATPAASQTLLDANDAVAAAVARLAVAAAVSEVSERCAASRAVEPGAGAVKFLSG